MRRSHPEVRSLTRALLNGKSDGTMAEDPVEAAERVLQLLAERLSPLVGASGFVMLLQRAFNRTRADHPWLEALDIEAQTPWRLPGMKQAAREAPDEAATAAEALVAEVIGLVARFLGADMAIRLVRQSFPDIVDGGDRGTGAEETTDE
jgi:hypothetical protein